jgi:hypothetical protein
MVQKRIFKDYLTRPSRQTIDKVYSRLFDQPVGDVSLGNGSGDGGYYVDRPKSNGEPEPEPEVEPLPELPPSPPDRPVSPKFERLRRVASPEILKTDKLSEFLKFAVYVEALGIEVAQEYLDTIKRLALTVK